MRWRLLPLILLPSLVFGNTQKSKPIYDFSKGLDTYHSSLSLPDGYVQASLNGFFDAQAPFSKRSGFQVAFTTRAYSFQQEWTYVDQTNTSWIIVRASDTIIANSLSGTASVKIATVSANNLVGEANAFGNAFFVDQAQGVYYWNGSSTTMVVGSPTGSLISQFHNRLWVSGAAIPNGNQVYGSALFSGTTWQTNINPSDPVQLTAGLQDNFDNVTAMYVYLDTMYVFKHYAIFGLYGFDQTTFQISQLTQECGCIDGNSIQTFNGGLKFVSLRGVEDFNGYSCTRISDPVKNLVDQAIQAGGFSQQSWKQDTASDFNSGSGVYIDTTTSPGFVQLQGYHDVFSSLSNWAPNGINGSGGMSVSGGIVSSNNSGLNQIAWINTNSGIVRYSTSTIYQSMSYSFNSTAANSQSIQLAVGNLTGISNTSTGNYNVKASPQSGGTQLDIIVSAAGGAAQATITTTTIDTNYHTLAMQVDPNQKITVYFDGQSMMNYTSPWGLTFSTFTNASIFCLDNSVGSYNCSVKSFDETSSSGSFKSQSHFVSSGTWGNFQSVYNLNGGSITFSICESANSTMIPSTCAAQSPNAQITISTGAYVQWYSTFTVTAATATPNIDNATVQWFTGSRQVPMASTVWDNRYWLSLTTSTVDTANDAVLVLSSKGSWGLLDIHAGGLTQYKGNLYHSDSNSTGNVYLDNSGTTDNGSNINAYLQTKDFKSDDLNSDNYFNSLYMSMDPGSSACTGTVSYFLDHNESSGFMLSTVQQSEFSASIALKIPFSLGTNQNFGHVISFKYQENDSCGLNLYGFSPYFMERPVQ